MSGPDTGGPPSGPRLSDRLAAFLLVAFAEIFKRIPRKAAR